MASRDVVCLQGARGSEGYLGTLPTGHSWFSNILALRFATGGGSRGSAVVMGIGKGETGALLRVEQLVLARGRAQVVRCRRADLDAGVWVCRVDAEASGCLRAFHIRVRSVALLRSGRHDAFA